jgi:SAM-dependent methyltransferase
MKKPIGVDSKELGLAAGLVLAKYFLKTEHLHYGYWSGDLEVNIANLKEAQDRYSEVLLSHIPDGTGSILDVGCGTGVLSRRLLDEGYRVESVSPSPFLTAGGRQIRSGALFGKFSVYRPEKGLRQVQGSADGKRYGGDLRFLPSG